MTITKLSDYRRKLGAAEGVPKHERVIDMFRRCPDLAEGLIMVSPGRDGDETAFVVADSDDWEATASVLWQAADKLCDEDGDNVAAVPTTRSLSQARRTVLQQLILAQIEELFEKEPDACSDDALTALWRMRHDWQTCQLGLLPKELIEACDD